jgi:hypothetical protein
VDEAAEDGSALDLLLGQVGDRVVGPVRCQNCATGLDLDYHAAARVFVDAATEDRLGGFLAEGRPAGSSPVTLTS